MARGKSRNPSVESLVVEAKNLAAQGIKEINLTGVNIGDFGKSTGETFLDLLRALDQTEELVRIRMGSVEPNLLSKDIISFVAQSERIAPHFHIPLQAGSDEVLALMKRRYNTSLFRQKVDEIRIQLPFAFIGVDVIAGMNGETKALFDKSYQFIEQLDVSQLHAFPYSERANTRALGIQGVVPFGERKQRTQMLIQLSDTKHQKFCEANLGRTVSVLFENQSNTNISSGWSENYIRVEVPFDAGLSNQTRQVLLKQQQKKGIVTASIL